MLNPDQLLIIPSVVLPEKKLAVVYTRDAGWKLKRS